MILTYPKYADFRHVSAQHLDASPVFVQMSCRKPLLNPSAAMGVFHFRWSDGRAATASSRSRCGCRPAMTWAADSSISCSFCSSLPEIRSSHCGGCANEGMKHPPTGASRFSWLRRVGRLWPKSGGSPLLAIKCCIENKHWADFLDWRTCRVAA